MKLTPVVRVLRQLWSEPVLRKATLELSGVLVQLLLEHLERRSVAPDHPVEPSPIYKRKEIPNAQTKKTP